MRNAIFAFSLVALAATNALAETQNSKVAKAGPALEQSVLADACLGVVDLGPFGFHIDRDAECERRKAGYIQSNLEMEAFKALLIKFGIKPSE